MVTIPIGMLAWGHLNTLLSESSRPGGPALPIRIITLSHRGRGITNGSRRLIFVGFAPDFFAFFRVRVDSGSGFRVKLVLFLQLVNHII